MGQSRRGRDEVEVGGEGTVERMGCGQGVEVEIEEDGGAGGALRGSEKQLPLQADKER